VDKKSKKVICTNFSNGKKHDFRLFKESRVRWTKKTKALTDSGYTGILKIQNTTRLPKKKRKGKELTKEEKQENRAIAVERVLNENVIGCLKRFKILSDRYRNRRKRFGLRFNLIAGIYNADLTR
jgi:hypothetical protein